MIDWTKWIELRAFSNEELAVVVVLTLKEVYPKIRFQGSDNGDGTWMVYGKHKEGKPWPTTREIIRNRTLDIILRTYHVVRSIDKASSEDRPVFGE